MTRRILIVDDDPQVLSLYENILNRGGYSVIAERSSKRAMEILEQDNAVELLVLDLYMPEPDGFEILKAMRAERPELPIVVISGNLGGSLLKASKLLGASISLRKTDVPDKLLETVNKMMS